MFSFNLRRLLVWFPYILFLVIPFHVFISLYMSFKMGWGMNDIKLILFKMWKEIFLILGFLLFFILKIIKLKKEPFLQLHKVDLLVLSFSIIGLFYTLGGTDFGIAMWSYRSITYMFLFYFLGRIVDFEEKDWLRFGFTILGLGVITSIIGVIQVEYFGPEFHAIFYGEDKLHYVFTSADYDKLRASSTFVSVHEFGLFMILGLFSSLYIFVIWKAKSVTKYVTLGLINLVLLVGLIYSLSRSSFLILIIGFLFLSIRKLQYLIFGLVVALVFYYALDFIGAFDSFRTVASGKDPSTQGHSSIILTAITDFLSNPIGIGLGEVGVVVRRFKPEAIQYEGEFFNILVQMGVLGVTFIILMSYKVFNIANKEFKTAENEIGFRMISIYIALIVICLFFRDLILPRDQMNFSLGWFYIGAYLTLLTNRSNGLKEYNFEK
ncbi:MAG: hypothetical protein LCH54_12310 [Bacteroidetes bacterium]|nr:hypothetical protein [Bacteroidota bacterium]